MYPAGGSTGMKGCTTSCINNTESVSQQKYVWIDLKVTKTQSFLTSGWFSAFTTSKCVRDGLSGKFSSGKFRRMSSSDVVGSSSFTAICLFGRIVAIVLRNDSLPHGNSKKASISDSIETYFGVGLCTWLLTQRTPSTRRMRHSLSFRSSSISVSVFRVTEISAIVVRESFPIYSRHHLSGPFETVTADTKSVDEFAQNGTSDGGKIPKLSKAGVSNSLKQLRPISQRVFHKSNRICLRIAVQPTVREVICFKQSGRKPGIFHNNIASSYNKRRTRKREVLTFHNSSNKAQASPATDKLQQTNKRHELLPTNQRKSRDSSACEKSRNQRGREFTETTELGFLGGSVFTDRK
ncbi:unnamed protein product [Microthlaspi erraticum]|uniref:Uncharacterized protein n=1 Tax=Microthlaspi erraticum TaxID=1685480 RepID=A0A6D2K5A0_9BRAS|nr:unnamed protein product [Microthlaspi erraticum]